MKMNAIDNVCFGMAVKATPEAKEFLSERLTERGIKKFEELTKFANKDSIDVNLSTVTRHLSIGMSKGDPYSQLIVSVSKGENYSFEPEGMSFFIIKAIKKAVNIAHSLSEHKNRLDNIL